MAEARPPALVCSSYTSVPAAPRYALRMASQREFRSIATARAGGDDWPSRMPAPDAHEGGESAWEDWQEASRRLDLAFAPTEPSSLAPMSTGSALSQLEQAETRPHLLSADALMVVARRNNRVCPRPVLWSQLYQVLKGERQA